jgi:LysM repeat protein
MKLRSSLNALGVLIISLAVSLFGVTASSTTAQASCGTTYTVSAGDTLSAIATECGTTVDSLLQANPAIQNPNYITVGQVIRLSGTAAGAEMRSYTVHPGDTLSAIASMFGTTVADLLAANPAITNPNLIYPGQEIRLPEPGTADSALRVQMYLIAINDNGRSGQAIGCGDSVVPVPVSIPATSTPLRAILEHLLAIDEAIYAGTDLYNVLYRSDLMLERVVIQDHIASIQLVGDLSLNEVCDDRRVLAQIQQTALQFPTVERVTLSINGTPFPFSSALTLDELKNAAYPTVSGTVKLSAGAYVSSLNNDPSALLNIVLEDTIALGDLNNDGLDDAAVVLASTVGGTGTFRELFAVLNHAGSPAPLTAVYLGDRVIINTISIVDGEISVDLLTHGRGAPACCPTTPQLKTYRLQEFQLVQID